MAGLQPRGCSPGAGADTFADLRAGLWTEGERLQATAHLFVVERAGEAPPDLAGCNATLLRLPGPGGASSTAARRALAAGDEAAAGALLEPSVLAYALQHRLYRQ